MCTQHLPQLPAVSRRTALLAAGGVGAVSAGAVSVGAASPATAGRRHGTADLTYTLGEDFPAFAPGEEAVRLPGTNFEDDGYYQQRWEIYEHIGTHVDAPAHFNPGGPYATELTVDELTPPAVVVDIARRAATDPDTVVTVADLQQHERRHGRIEDGSAVIMLSGWGAKVGDADAYRGTDAAGVLHFPGFGTDATEWLIRRRRIRALGVDTLSIDPGNSATFEVHALLNGAERYGVENLANVHRLPARGARLTVGLIPFKLGSGGPARVLARW